MCVKIDIVIKYTTELNLCRSTLFSQTYYTLLVSSGVDFEPHPNRYPSDSFGYLLKYREVSSTRRLSVKICVSNNTTRFSTTVKTFNQQFNK